jgi:hypothetical protein
MHVHRVTSSHVVPNEIFQTRSLIIVARNLIIARTSHHPQARQASCRRDEFFRRIRLLSLPTTNDLTAFPKPVAPPQHSQQQLSLSNSEKTQERAPSNLISSQLRGESYQISMIAVNLKLNLVGVQTLATKARRHEAASRFSL